MSSVQNRHLKQCYIVTGFSLNFWIECVDGTRKSPVFYLKLNKTPVFIPPSVMQTINPPPKKTPQNCSNPFVFHTSTLEMQSLHFLRERRAQARRLSGSSNPLAGKTIIMLDWILSGITDHPSKAVSFTWKNNNNNKCL